jgi:hypothetical protein
MSLWCPLRSIYISICLSIYSPLLDICHFFSFLILYTVGRTPWTRISLSQGLYLYTEQHKHRINAHYIHALSGIRTYDPSVRASEESSCLGPCGTVIGSEIFLVRQKIPSGPIYADLIKLSLSHDFANKTAIKRGLSSNCCQ